MRVVITGMGCMSSLGNSVEEMYKNLLVGKSAVRFYPEWAEYKGLQAHLGAPVPEYDIKTLPRSTRRTMSRMSEMASLATIQALKQAGISEVNSSRTVLILGSTSGSPDTMETYFKLMFEKGGPEGQVSTSFFKIMNHSVAANVGAAINYTGPYLSPSSACATSTQAMILGWELLQTGMYDCVIAGGADELSYLSSAIFDIVYAASRGFNEKPQESPRPFDSGRDGLVVSEGAGVVVMETADFAAKRKATVLAEMAGGAYISDCGHMSQSQHGAMITTMEEALKRSKLEAKSINYVNAHATGTLQGDAEEAQAIAELFGDQVPVSSLKGYLGHSLAACGALEAIACIKMLEMGEIIPTRNLKTTDPKCKGIWLLKDGEIVKQNISAVMSNNFAFGGMNTSLILKKVE
jgi:3-oxoacyl-[acyl-carrier-protein] synthase II